MLALNRDKSWDFDAGLLPLDFANTADWHGRPDPNENLDSYADLVEWSWKAGLLTEDAAHQLLEQAGQRPQEASAVLTKAISLREALYHIFSHIAADKPAPHGAVETLNAALAEALSRVRIAPSQDGFSWGWSGEERNLERMLWPILRLTAELLTSDEIKRIGECADDRGCGYLFLDNSRNRSRRWCSMESCGNRAKVQRHYIRQRDSA